MPRPIENMLNEDKNEKHHYEDDDSYELKWVKKMTPQNIRSWKHEYQTTRSIKARRSKTAARSRYRDTSADNSGNCNDDRHHQIRDQYRDDHLHFHHVSKSQEKIAKILSTKDSDSDDSVCTVMSSRPCETQDRINISNSRESCEHKQDSTCFGGHDSNNINSQSEPIIRRINFDKIQDHQMISSHCMNGSKEDKSETSFHIAKENSSLLLTTMAEECKWKMHRILNLERELARAKSENNGLKRQLLSLEVRMDVRTNVATSPTFQLSNDTNTEFRSVATGFTDQSFSESSTTLSLCASSISEYLESSSHGSNESLAMSSSDFLEPNELKLFLKKDADEEEYINVDDDLEKDTVLDEMGQNVLSSLLALYDHTKEKENSSVGKEENHRRLAKASKALSQLGNKLGMQHKSEFIIENIQYQGKDDSNGNYSTDQVALDTSNISHHPGNSKSNRKYREGYAYDDDMQLEEGVDGRNNHTPVPIAEAAISDNDEGLDQSMQATEECDGNRDGDEISGLCESNHRIRQSSGEYEAHNCAFTPVKSSCINELEQILSDKNWNLNSTSLSIGCSHNFYSDCFVPFKNDGSSITSTTNKIPSDVMIDILHGGIHNSDEHYEEKPSQVGIADTLNTGVGAYTGTDHVWVRSDILARGFEVLAQERNDFVEEMVALYDLEEQATRTSRKS